MMKDCFYYKKKNRLGYFILVIWFIIQLFILSGCARNDDISEGVKKPDNKSKTNLDRKDKEKVEMINADGMTIKDRFIVPYGFSRIEAIKDSYGYYLRKLQLKPDGTEARYYDGRVKKNRDIYDAVIDIDVGERDLQQCADAAMRLKGEYLYKHGRFNEISFDFANGFKADYKKWMEGYRIKIEGNRAYWVKRGNVSNTYNNFRIYMDVVFAYANTVSLANQMRTVSVNEMVIGDVFITAKPDGNGHAVIVVDMAENKNTGKKLFMVAQSYMPAQDIQILKNPTNLKISPWYDLDFGDELKTPEWKFNKNELKTFN